jgi:hypothetical protein
MSSLQSGQVMGFGDIEFHAAAAGSYSIKKSSSIPRLGEFTCHGEVQLER